jgi:GNAT superfamily N-acetyltransferase
MHDPSACFSVRPTVGAGGRVCVAADADAEAGGVGCALAVAPAVAGPGGLGATSTVGAVGGCDVVLSQPAANVITNEAARALFPFRMARSIHDGATLPRGVHAVPLRFAVVPTSHAHARQMLAGYYGEIRKRFGFDVSRQAAVEDMDPPGGRFVVAYEDDEPVASGGIRSWEPGVCEIKRMFVAPKVRRHGYGRALLEALEKTAREAGFRRIVLDTLDSHTEAMQLYDTCGYQRVPRYNENPYASVWFAKDL